MGGLRVEDVGIHLAVVVVVVVVVAKPEKNSLGNGKCQRISGPTVINVTLRLWHAFKTSPPQRATSASCSAHEAHWVRYGFLLFIDQKQLSDIPGANASGRQEAARPPQNTTHASTHAWTHATLAHEIHTIQRLHGTPADTHTHRTNAMRDDRTTSHFVPLSYIGVGKAPFRNIRTYPSTSHTSSHDAQAKKNTPQHNTNKNKKKAQTSNNYIITMDTARRTNEQTAR